jgi:hypothetical protein
MRDGPKECRAYAARCAELAAETNEPRLKQELEQLSAVWNELAVMAEKPYGLGYTLELSLLP